jgi:hypothetical protein
MRTFATPRPLPQYPTLVRSFIFGATLTEHRTRDGERSTMDCLGSPSSTTSVTTSRSVGGV